MIVEAQKKTGLFVYAKIFVDSTLVMDKIEAKKVQERAFNHIVVNGKLYKRLFTTNGRNSWNPCQPLRREKSSSQGLDC